MTQVILYSKPECGLCHELKALLANLQDELSFAITERNIEQNLADFERFRYLIPVLEIENGPLLYPPHDANSIRVALQNAM